MLRDPSKVTLSKWQRLDCGTELPQSSTCAFERRLRFYASTFRAESLRVSEPDLDFAFFDVGETIEDRDGASRRLDGAVRVANGERDP